MAARIWWTAKKHRPHDGLPDHHHGPGCGHVSAEHGGQHVDYLVEGHAHHAHEGHWDECNVEELAFSSSAGG